ncbi:hypothetical protein HY358_01195 [Candidatus Roizmanbacteria bacterium]|nr:hypothetical protein [Candidatus Roizmanbacteria bacterium]
MKIKLFIIFALLSTLVFTRFLNISWGLPYPFHPDERNMADALLRLGCSKELPKLLECFNPHFFAYGQLPLYIGYLFIQFYHLVFGKFGSPTTFIEAVIALRILSAISSVPTVFVLVKIVALLMNGSSKLKLPITNYQLLITSLIFIFSPVLIQFAHFGTTESLLILFYCSIVLLSLLYQKGHIRLVRFAVLTAIISGLAIGTKVSAVVFIGLPLFVVFSNWGNNFKLKQVPLIVVSLILFFVITGVAAFLASPFNLLSLNEFLSSMRYESDVALGILPVFYSRQFIETAPIFFQAINILPYALGWPTLLFSVLGMLFLPYTPVYRILRIAFLVAFLPPAFMYAKWTRFIAPSFPIMLVFASMFLLSSRLLRRFTPRNHIVIYTLIFISIIPGIAYLSIYTSEDVRFTASRWIYKNVSNGSYILSETANVVDIPIQLPTPYPPTNYHYLSFDFYNLDSDQNLGGALEKALQKADYIFVPSRRIFANHTCFEIRNSKYEIRIDERCEKLQEMYPKLNSYYEDFFSGKLGFEKVAEFTSYPKIKIGGATLLETPDEDAEETWSVFDHPVIRIYQRK